MLLTRWYDVDRHMAALNDLYQQMDRLFSDLWGGLGGVDLERPTLLSGTWPRANLYDSGSSLVAVLQVPGVNEKDLQVEVQGDVLTVSGTRETKAPEGYRVHRAERTSNRFSRSFGLPSRVEAERTSAKLHDGELVVRMEKHPDAQPRRITVSAS